MTQSEQSSEGYFNTTAMVCSGLMRRACVPGATTRDLRAYIDSVDELDDMDWRKLSLLVEETPRTEIATAVAAFRQGREPKLATRPTVKAVRACVGCGGAYSYKAAICIKPGKWMCNRCAEEATAP